MKENIEQQDEQLGYFNLLPDELTGYILSRLQEPEDLSSVALTCKYFNNIANSVRIQQTTDFVKLILAHVSQGEYAKAKYFLKYCPEMMIAKAELEESCGRYFENISPFQYMLWSLDVNDMWEMMKSCIPDGAAGNELKRELLEQYYDVKENGLTYTVKQRTDTLFSHRDIAACKVGESHYDFLSLINDLEQYKENFNKWGYMEKHKFWYEEVGVKQEFLPIHVLTHYNNLGVKLSPRPGRSGPEIHTEVTDPYIFLDFGKDEDINLPFIIEFPAIIAGSIYVTARIAAKYTFSRFFHRPMPSFEPPWPNSRRVTTMQKYYESLIPKLNEIEAELSLPSCTMTSEKV